MRWRMMWQMATQERKRNWRMVWQMDTVMGHLLYLDLLDPNAAVHAVTTSATRCIIRSTLRAALS